MASNVSERRVCRYCESFPIVMNSWEDEDDETGVAANCQNPKNVEVSDGQMYSTYMTQIGPPRRNKPQVFAHSTCPHFTERAK